MKTSSFRIVLTAVALLAAATPATALVDVDLVVQMPLAVVEVEDAGYPRDDLGLLASGLAASELAPAEVIDVLRWAPVVWYLDELADGDLFLDADPVRVDPVRVDTVRFDADPRRLRLIEDRDGSWLITTREDLVLLDLADVEIERQWVVDRDVAVRDVDGRDVVLRDRDRRLDDRGMGAYVQWLHEQGLRGRDLADAIHAELRRRGVPAGPKDRLDGPPPASRRFVAERLPEVLVVDGRLVELRDGDDDRRLLPPGQARERLAAAPRFEGVRDAAGRLTRRGEGAEGRDVAARGRGRADRGGGPPDHAAANRGGGQGKAGGAGGGQGRGQDKAKAGGEGQGKGKANAGGGGGGQGKGKARAGGGGGQGKGKGKANAGGGGGQGKGKANASGGGGGGGKGKGKGKGGGG